ncbi:MAG: methylmalonyl Co-A mutase-associated GTPase MeaB [Flavobacteriaceae bacterium]|nr:methylmalonyl Co-A mutase-associated GTPase MeaB [Flavobacteriaceae bacterium]
MKNKKVNINSINNPSISKFLEHILKGNITYLSRAITLIESSKTKDIDKASELLQVCLPHANNSIRIGITGVPGVGKSTFIEAFGNHLIQLGKRVAVLAIDPSSSINKGSVLGDKTRMGTLVKEENAFIRPSPTGDNLGGVAKKTKETIILCEAAGYDIILIETVGVGQSETIVHSMVDFFLLLKIAGAGDELQGIKRGIMEMADAIVINKADNGNIKNAELAKNEFERALHLHPLKENEWQPKVTTCSALYNDGITDIWRIISEFLSLTKANNSFDKNRENQNQNWLLQSINQQLQDDFHNNKKVKKELKNQLKNIEKQLITPFEASKKLIEFYKQK